MPVNTTASKPGFRGACESHESMAECRYHKKVGQTEKRGSLINRRRHLCTPLTQRLESDPVSVAECRYYKKVGQSEKRGSLINRRRHLCTPLTQRLESDPVSVAECRYYKKVGQSEKRGAGQDLNTALI